MGFLLLISFLAYFIKHESNSIFYIENIHTYIKVCCCLPRCYSQLPLTACKSPVRWSLAAAAAPAAVAVLKDLNSHFVRHRMEHKRVLTYLPRPLLCCPPQVAWRFLSRLIDLKCSDLSGRWRFPCCCQHPEHPPPLSVLLLPCLLVGDVAERQDFARLWLWLFDSTDFLSDTTRRQASWNFSCEHIRKLSLKFTRV